jgi:signal transduction histidine kinase
VLAEMRTLLLELRPAALVEASLEELLKHLTEATIGRARLTVDLKIDGIVGLPTDVKIGLYRVAQEALNNIAKHSGANHATVTLTTSALCETCCTSAVALSISDDGKGFNPKDITGEHLGVGIMKERAEAIGAELLIDSKPGQGTNIKWTDVSKR